MVFIHRHSSNLRLPCSAVLSTKVLCTAPSELGISRHLACAVGPSRTDRNHFSFSRKAIQSVFAWPKANYESVRYLPSYCMMVKKENEIQPGFEPGSSEF